MIRIIVDSAADCRREDGVYDSLVPLTVSIAGKDYLDGVNLTADLFYDLLVLAEEFPKTSQPSPESYVQLFQEAKDKGDQVLCFTISSALSGTYQSATIAKTMVDYEDIYIIDTRMASHLIGLLAEHARVLIRQGKTAPQIYEICEQMKKRIKVFAGLDTLEYLYKGGRLSRASAAVGQIAGIKPIVTISEEGTVNAGAKVIGVPRAIQSIVTKVQSLELDEDFPIYTLYTAGTEHTEKLEKKLSDAGYRVSDRRQVGPTIGAHVGPNVYGVVVVTK